MVELLKPKKILLGATSVPLHVIGQINVTLKHGNCTCQHPVYVVRELRVNLLGLPAIQALHVFADIGSVDGYSKDIYQQYPALFQGLGTFGEPYHIKLKPNATPFSLYSARNVPIPLLDKVKSLLNEMESTRVISQVETPTDWCAGMVVVPKKNGDIRICVDLKPLNESVLREVHPLPKVDTTLAMLSGAKIFSKIDAKSGFWQVPLAEEACLLATFITPFGRYCFNKLPFGISSAPEHFQRIMSKLLVGLEGVVCQMDDTLVFGTTQEEHDRRLHATLNRIQLAGMTLNKEKCLFNKPRLKFLGHIIDSSGISPDPDKSTAIKEFPPPCNVSDLRRFMGMVTQMGKFSPNIAQLSQPCTAQQQTGMVLGA